MKKQVGIMLILLAVGINVKAQNEKDAFRYAQYSPIGTARHSALAGSMGAYGADFSGLSAGNPGGIGLFKRMELTITPSFSYSKIFSQYNDEVRNGVDDKVSLNNLGVVFAVSAPSKSKWKSMQFATGLNNLARYNGTSITFAPNKGNINGTTNFFDYVAARSNGSDYRLLENVAILGIKGIALDAWNYILIDSISGKNNQYGSMVGDNFNQMQIKESRGYLNEYVFSFGGNYDDQLFVGATIGIPFFNYYQGTIYTESRNTFYDSLIVFDEFSSRAIGVNLKLGIIYQPIKCLRIGAAFHTPTRYPNVAETYQSSFDIWGTRDSISYDISRESGRGDFDYQLTTPYRAMANIAFIYKSKGFINVDYELTDYSTSQFQSKSSRSYQFIDENKNIKKYYGITHTVRIGGELNLSPIALRLGYAYSSNPYNKNKVEKDGSIHSVSAGIGIKGKIFFADFAYIYRFSEDKDVFYEHESINPYTNQIVNQFFALTLGCKIGTW